MTADQSAAVRRRLEAVWRLDAARIIARIGRIVRDVGMAEEFAHDALVAALEQWPRDGEPEQPVAWLTTTARRRALDYLRHRQMAGGKAAEIGFELDFQHLARSDDASERVDDDLDDDIGDDLLRLMFTACHPMLSPEARCALTLKVMGGLTTAEIARAYLRPEATIAQRIVRAKRALAAARVPFEVPRRAELAPRLASVLEVIYLIFNEAHAATAGEEWLRPGLCEQALRLGRVLCGLMPEQGEVFGLAALMELTASRFPARVTADGTPILLMDQDRGRWDPLLIRRGLAALASAETCGGPLGPYTLQAAIAACHARAHRAEDTDWMRISALYDALAGISPSPVISLNRAVAIAMAFGPQAGLDIVETLTGDPLLADYHLLPSVRGDLLARLGRIDEARREFERAATMTANARERTLLLARAQHPRSGED